MNMKINWGVRLRNPYFWIAIIGSIFTTILTYNSMAPQDLTTWEALGTLLMSAIMNPYLLGNVIWNVGCIIIDFTTHGPGDSKQALTYKTPKK